MISFPSAFTKNDLVQPGKIISTNLQTTIKNAAGAFMNNALGGSEISKDSLGERLKETWAKYDFDDSIDNINFTVGLDTRELDGWRLYDKVSVDGAFHENARKIPALTLASINKYRKVFSSTAVQIMPPVETKDGTKSHEWYSEAISPSLFGGLFGVRSQGITMNSPLMHTSSINYDGTSEDASSKKEGSTDLTESKALAKQDIQNQINDLKQQIMSIDENIQSVTQSKYETPKSGEEDENQKESKENFEKNKQEKISSLNKSKESYQKEIEELQKQLDSIDNASESDLAKMGYDPASLASRPHLNVKDLPSDAPAENSNKEPEESQYFVQLNNDDYDFTDCSIKTLVELSNGKHKGNKINPKRTLGRATYRYADFMFCEDLGKISNNHLITLRKFAMPIGDNIYRYSRGGEKEIACIGKLITWFGTEKNKLEDICKYNYKATWKPLTAELEDIQSQEDNNHLLPSIVNMFNPAYNRGVEKGFWGGNNAIYGWIAGKANRGKYSFLDNQGTYENSGILGYRDPNRVYEPKNTIQDTHVYEGKLQFSHEFTLKFNYTLRAYDGINPKSAFLDLIGNILNVTYKDGTFWGGAKRWIGAPRNNKGWSKVNQMFDKISKGLHGGIEDLFGCSSLEQLASLCGSWLASAGEFIKGAYEAVKGMYNSGEAKTMAKKGVHSAANVFMGMLKNKLGRPAMYAAKSLLSGDNVGLWHVTVGNPRNPILSMGNLILDKSEIRHYGPLGIDDFPTGLEVTVTLKHARSRDARAIGEMYTCGEGSLILPLTAKKFKQYYGDLKEDNKDEYEAFESNGYGDVTADDIQKLWGLKI